ncbi:acetylxylan esterase, partial [Verrucomicrobia bacterium]|nr:acetylxylan esterase [Verrucomicrobiota bacterium]
MKKTTRLLRTSKTELIARCLAACFAVGVTTLSIAGLDVRALPEDQLPNDSRLAPPKDLNGYFPFRLPTTLDDWEQRASQLRRHLLVMNGLWPMPTRTPLNPVIHGKLDQGDYTVEKVYFESFPGFYVTGSLYRPKGFEGPRPGVLSPHGHWSNGRFTENLDIWNDLNQGAERFENGGRSPLQSRNVQLARMGCVVFHYDMVGYADSIQITEDLAHH